MKKTNTQKGTTEITLKPGQGITEELMTEVFGPEDLDTGDLGEPDASVEEKIVFRRD